MKLFYSYSHKDEDLRNEIATHLSPLKEKGLIDEWHDRKIPAGGDLHKEISAHIETSHMILLLLSPDYLASSECRNEMLKALELRKAYDTIVIPVIARTCAWKYEKMLSDADLLAIPDDAIAITEWDNKDRAYFNIYEHINGIVTQTPFCLRREFRDDLTKVEFISQQKKNITLDDIFVFPRIRSQYGNRQIKRFEDLWTKKAFLVLTGDDRSGKTVICRKLFLNEVDNGTPAVLISGSDVKSPINHEALVEKTFQEQFSGSYAYWKNRPNKLLILDNFTHNTRPEFIDFAKEFFRRIVIMISDDEYLVYFNDDESLANFELLALNPLGHSNQEELIKKWVSLNDAPGDNLEIPYGRIDQIEDNIDSIIIQNKIVPRYPFYILSILQTLEAFMPQDLQITAYGHCYQVLITARLRGAGIRTEDIDSSMNFLKYLAFEIFNQEYEFSPVQFEEFLQNYKSEFLIKESVVNRLTNNDFGILRNHKGGYEFSYPFIYYFLLGSYFAANYETHRELIREISKRNHLQENAYILIFTVHHTQKLELIDTILTHTKCEFDNAAVATLSAEETSSLEGVLRDLPEKILSHRPIEEERQVQRKRQDELEAELGDLLIDRKSKDYNLVNNHLNAIYKAVKNMEILGQILRNKYGSLHRKKIEKVIRHVSDTGLHLINVYTNQDRISNLEGFFSEVLKSRNLPEENKRKVEEFLKRQIRLWMFLTIISLLSKIVVSIRKPELLEIVETVYPPQNTPAYDLLHIFFLLDTSEKLSLKNVEMITSVFRKFKKSKNTVAKRLLSLWVQNYVNTHKIQRELREKLFNALEIKYKPNPEKNYS